MWFIIAGTRGVERVVESGTFFCPRCAGAAPYSRRAVTTYLTVFFIPLIPLSRTGEIVRCEGCSGIYEAGVLAAPEDSGHAEGRPWRCARCRNVNPPEYTTCVSCNAPR